MILIADSGGTKTDWRLLDGKNIRQFRSDGMNPYIVDETSMDKSVSELSATIGPVSIAQVFFYGAGCSSAENIDRVSNCLNKYFPGASISVQHDLIAAARALCGREKGIACILGTGANSCLYDGSEIIENIPSLGYVLGDEGGGTYLGKSLISYYFNQSMPEDLAEKLEARYDMRRNTVLENIYQGEKPANYLAGFSKFIFDNKSHPFIDTLIRESFKLFFQKNVLKYKDAQSLPVHFTGSVAFYYSTILRQVGSESGLVIKNVMESPISGLALFHQD